MERRIQEYERRGVEATLDMQQAARTVALENARLRAMLSQLGASAADVDDFLQSSQDQDAAQTLSSVRLRAADQQAEATPGETKPLDTKPPVPEPKRETFSNNSVQTTDGSSCEGSEGTPAFGGHRPMHDAGSWSMPPETPHYGSPPWAQYSAAAFDKLDVLASASVQQGCCDSRTQFTMPISDSRAASPSTAGPSPGAITPNGPQSMSPSDPAFATSPMEMSCNAAAQIIAEMQGHVDRELAKERLGCNGQDECFVRNTMLFQILESGGHI